jgi:hypothetical protein
MEDRLRAGLTVPSWPRNTRVWAAAYGKERFARHVYCVGDVGEQNAGRGVARADFRQKEKTRMGTPGFSKRTIAWGDSIAPDSKQHRAATIHTHVPDFHNLLDQGAATARAMRAP